METTESPAENEKAPVSEENQPAPDSNPNISETNPVDASDSKTEQESEKIDFDETLPTSDNPYRVSVTMTIAVAYPKPSDEHSRILDELVKKNKKTIESPKPLYFLHCEYGITPQNSQTVTDVVTYTVAAKVFTDSDSRVVKTWDDGSNVWVAWMHTHEIDVTMENIQSLHDHVIEVKLWDAKEKISSKARGDRPRAFRLPSETEIRFPGQGVHGVVSRISSCWKSLQPKSSTTFGSSENSKAESLPLDTPDNTSQEQNSSKVHIDEDTKKRGSEIGRLAGIDPHDDEKKRMNELKSRRSGAKKKLQQNNKEAASKVAMNKRAKSSEDKNNSKKERTTSGRRQLTSEKVKAISLKLRFESLFSGSGTAAARIKDVSGSILDGFVTVVTEKPLLPLSAIRALNPMSIKIKSIKHLPDTPIPRSVLAKTSKPVYCQYKFLNDTVHSTVGRPHGKHVYFEDTHVVFLGSLDGGALREYILSNSFNVDVHDRDQKVEEETGDGNIFGIEKYDSHLSSVALVSAKQTSHNAFQSLKNGFDPFGVAKVPLMEILQGGTKVNAEVAVVPCSMPEIINDPKSTSNDRNGLIGVPGAVDRPQRPPILPGDYFQATTTLKVKITLACPFVPLDKAPRMSPLPNQICPFSRFVLFFDYSNKDLLHRVETFVTMENARALGLQDFEKNIIDAALSTFKLTREQKRSLTLDIITGFHVIDGNIHLLVLEGLQNGAMKRLLEEMNFDKKDDKDFLVHLFDTSMTFSSRLYSALDVDLCRVRLHQSMKEIMQQPLLYIRDIVPKDCLECVLKLFEMTKMRKLRDVFRADLFPTAEMVICMSREFGIPLTNDDFEEPQTQVEQTNKDEELVGVEMIRTEMDPGSMKKFPPLDNSNINYEELLRSRKLQSSKVNYVSSNIIAVQEVGKRRRPSGPSVRSLLADGTPHNYSTQALNSTEMAKGVMREMLFESDPQGRYSFNAEYNSMMFDPVDVDSYYRKKDLEAKEKWRTRMGFVYPGKRSSIEDNQHSLKPGESRISDLRLSFRDNVLHRNVLEPILDRDRMKWKDREKDLQLYSRPDLDFGNRLPHSIMLAGDLKYEEENRFKKSEVEDWRNKLVVDDKLMRFHRLLWETENSQRANQIDRLTGLLKDQPMKYSLAQPPFSYIPPLSVLMNPSVDTAARESGKKLPPAFDPRMEKNVGYKPGPYDIRRWNIESNRIPITDEQHQVFARKHGHDMNRYHKEKHLLSSRVPIRPLTDEELQTHLFRIPPIEKSSQDSQEEFVETERENEVYGRGPRDLSEYRIMYPVNEINSRLREIYPRHTFHGFGPLDRDGKPVTRDASVHFVTTKNDLLEHGVKAENFVKPRKGTMHRKEASVEVLPAPTPPKEILPIA